MKKVLHPSQSRTEGHRLYCLNPFKQRLLYCLSVTVYWNPPPLMRILNGAALRCANLERDRSKNSWTETPFNLNGLNENWICERTIMNLGQNTISRSLIIMSTIFGQYVVKIEGFPIFLEIILTEILTPSPGKAEMSLFSLWGEYRPNNHDIMRTNVTKLWTFCDIRNFLWTLVS